MHQREVERRKGFGRKEFGHDRGKNGFIEKKRFAEKPEKGEKNPQGRREKEFDPEETDRALQENDSNTGFERKEKDRPKLKKNPGKKNSETEEEKQEFSKRCLM